MSCILRECVNPECGYADGKHPKKVKLTGR